MAEVKYTEMIPQYIGMKLARNGLSIKEFAKTLGKLKFPAEDHTISLLADEFVSGGIRNVEFSIEYLNDYYAGDANV